jgi:hypothetical protein
MPKIEPAGWYQPTFFPQSMLHSVDFDLGGKVLGVKNMYAADAGHVNNLNRGWTHMMNPGEQSGQPTLPWDQHFVLMKRHFNDMEGHKNDSNTNWFYQSGQLYAQQTGYTPGLVLTGEIGEDLMNVGGVDPMGKDIAFHRGYSDAMAAQGYAMHQHRNFGGYDGVEGAGWLARTFNNASQRDRHIAAMSSQSEARKRWDQGNEQYSGETNYAARYNACNILHKFYYRSFYNHNGYLVPNFMFAYEKMYVAYPDRRQIVFAWELIEEIEGSVVNWLPPVDFYFSNPSGVLTVGWRSKGYLPAYIALNVSFFSFLLTEGMVIWSDDGGYRNVPPDNHTQALFASGGNRRTWTPTGGSPQGWQQGNGSMPQDNGVKGFAPFPLTAVDAIHQGAYLYSQIRGRITTSLRYAKFSHDGGSTWIDPVTGSLGAEVSKFGAPNPGQANLAHRAFDRRGICLFGQGPEGKVVIYHNPFKGPHQSDNVRVQEGGTTYNLGTVYGGELRIETFA